MLRPVARRSEDAAIYPGLVPDSPSQVLSIASHGTSPKVRKTNLTKLCYVILKQKTASGSGWPVAVRCDDFTEKRRSSDDCKSPR